MLLHRSILSKVCLVLVICIVNAQYEYGKKEKEEVKEVKEEDEERDYEKVFAQETAAALTAAAAEEEPENTEQSDYVAPTDFENYFKPSHIFGESNNQDVKAEPQKKKKESLQPNESKKERDYSVFYDGPLKEFFEESDKRQEQLHKEQSNKDEEIIPPGPSYISHQVPAHNYRYGFNDEEDKSASASEDAPAKKNQGKSKPDADYRYGFDYEEDKSASASEDAPAKKNQGKSKPGADYRYGFDYEEDKSASASEDAPSKKNQGKSKPGADFEEGRVEKNDNDYTLPAPLTFEPFKVKKPKVDYNTGKSSSTVSQTQHPSASGYDKHTSAASTPYEKYSFQPAEDYEAENSKFFDSILSTVAPYNPTYKRNSEPNYETQSSEDSPSQLQGKGCRKVSSSDKDDMNCFVCQNPKTNAKYTQCSYSTQKKPVDYYEGNAAKYSVPQQEEGNSYRYKRYANNEEDDPYTFIRNRARKATHESGVPSDYGAGFSYEAEHYDESKPEVTFSEQHSEEIKKNPENCKKVDRKGMTCTVCQDPKTGGNFEQCSYTSKPKEKKYAYVTEKKFDNDEPQETHVVSQSKAAESNEKEKDGKSSKKNTELFEEYQGSSNQEKSPKKRNEEERKDHEAKPSEKKEAEDDYEYHFKHIGTPSFTDSSYKGASSENVEDKKKKDDFSDFDEYHFKFFPEFAKEESRQEPVQESYEVPVPEATKQNVETVLAEFTKKDRSNCKKAQKKGMTCYLCVDKNNIQHEECMYVQESKPETKHVAYHEVKATDKAAENTKVPETEKNKSEESKQENKQNKKDEAKQESKQEPAVAESRNNYYFLRAPASVSDMDVAASEQVGAYERYKPEEESKKKKKRSDKPAKPEPKPDASAYDAERINDKADPTIKTPAEFIVSPGEGAFSDETKAVYSKELGIQLPKYMLEKSEFEKEFDAFSGSF